MKFAAILACAGRGRRLKSDGDKAFVRIKGIPLFYYSYNIFKQIDGIGQIAIVARAKYFSFIRSYIKDKRLLLVEGGARRQDSVYRGVLAVDKTIDYVLIHDGARPFINRAMIEQIKNLVLKFKAVTFAVKVNDALKEVEKGFIKHTLSRDNLWFVQTPQAFKRELLIKAYDKFKESPVYDDTQLVESMGRRIKVLAGSVLNMKITYPDDLCLAKAILRIKNIRSKGTGLKT